MTGSSGLLGSALRDRLKKNGYHVLRLTRTPQNSKETSASQCSSKKNGNEETLVDWSPSEGLRNPELLNGIAGFIHLAGKSIASGRWTRKVKEELRSSRVDATKILCHQIAQLPQPPIVFLSASAVGIYGNTGDKTISETSPYSKDFLGKLAEDWENASLIIARTNIRVCWMRFGVVMSPRGGALEKVIPLFRWGLGGRLGSGDQMWSWVGLEDAVSAAIFLLENSECKGAFNVVAPESISNRAWTEELAKYLHRKAWFPAPAWGLRLILGEMADGLLLNSCNAIPQKLLEHRFKFATPTFRSYLESLQ